MEEVKKQGVESLFCPYEQALALKDLGFDEPYYFAIHVDSANLILREEENKWYLAKGVIAPTYSQAFRWFREKYGLVFNFMSYNIVKPGEYHWSITWDDEAKAGGIVKTYEEAELACLKKLIEIVKNDNTSK